MLKLLQEFGWHEVQLHEAELQKALLRVNSTAQHRCCGSRTGRFCRSRETCGVKIDLSYLDPFREGVNSEFESYGFCVVAHFKLLKFVGWLFLILQFMYLPQCVLNASKGSTNVALTSLSNLVDIRGIGENSTLNGTVAVMYVVVHITRRSLEHISYSNPGTHALTDSRNPRIFSGYTSTLPSRVLL